MIVEPFLSPELKDVIFDFLDLTSKESTKHELDLVKKHPELFDFDLITVSSLKKRSSVDQRLEHLRSSHLSVQSKASEPDSQNKEENSGGEALSLSQKKVSGSSGSFLKASLGSEKPGSLQKVDEEKEVLSGRADSNVSSDSNPASMEDLPDLPQLKIEKTRSVIKLHHENLDSVTKALISGESIQLGGTLLKRLRKYRLVTSIVYHEGKALVGIAPIVEGRITDATPKS